MSIEHSHIYVYVQKNYPVNSDSTESIHEENNTYAIRITRSYPVEGVRFYLMKNSLQPRLSDSRDLVFEILGDVWTYKKRLISLIKGI